MENSWRSIANRLLENYSQIAFIKDRINYLSYLLYFLQFLQISVVKFATLSQPLNSKLQTLGNWAKSFLINELSFTWVNFVVLFLATTFVIMMVFKQRPSLAHFQGFKKLQKKYQILTIVVYIYVAIELLILLCFTINLEYYYNCVNNKASFPSTFSLGISIITSTFILFTSTIYSEGLLLGKWTILIVFLSLQFSFVSIPMKLVSVLALFTFSIEKPPFERILIRLLLFIFLMDFLAFAASIAISFMHFMIFSILIVSCEFIRPQDRFLTSVERQNNLLIQNIQKLNKNKKFEKKQEISLLTIIFKNKDKIERMCSGFPFDAYKNMKSFFENVNVYSYDWLSLFYKLKLELNLKQYPKDLTLKLQQAIFFLKYQKLNLKILKNVMKLKDQALTSKTFKEFKLITETQLLLDEINSKQREYTKVNKFIAFSEKIQHYNELVLDCCEGMIQYFTRLKTNQLNQQKLIQILGNICIKEEKLQKYIKEIEIYKGTSTQIRLHDYAMKLLNFDYQPKMMRRGEIEFNINILVNSHYIYLTDNKITDVSNRVLTELKRKKEQIIGENFDMLIPHQLKHYLQSRLDKVFETAKSQPQFILPFIQMREFLLPYKIKIDINFDLNAGIKYVIHFLKSQEIQQTPTFLYSVDNDQIVNFCPLFKQYIKLHKRRLDTNTLGTDIFGADLGYLIVNCQRTQISCVLKRQKSWQHNIPIKLVILEIYKLKNGNYALIQLISKEIQQENSQVKFKSLDNLVTKDFFQDEQLQMKLRNQAKNQFFYCRIKHPCEDNIYVKMSELRSNYRKSYIKWILLFLILICATLTLGIISIGFQITSKKINYQYLYDLLLKKDKQIQAIYSLFYQYYQYYHIYNFPEHYTRIQAYNMTRLVEEYYNKSNGNIIYLSTTFSNNFILGQNSYTLLYDKYNKTLTTSPLSLLEFLTNIKQALTTNDPTFSVRNGQTIEKIISSFKNINLQTLQDAIQYVQNIIMSINGAIFTLVLIIKIIQLKLQATYREIFKIYNQIGQSQIDRSLQKYRQLVYLGINSITYKFQGKKWKEWKSLEASRIAASIKKQSTIDLSYDSDNNKQQNKIRWSTNSILLIKRFFLIFIPFFCCFYFFLFTLNLKSYKSNADLIIQKATNNQETTIALLKQSENYFQLAMQQILPENQRLKSVKLWNYNIYTNYLSQLPPFFNHFLQTQRQILGSNICNYFSLSQSTLYKHINCSQILNGAMEASFSTSLVLFKQLIQTYKGTYLSQFGETFSRKSQYPVFMEICYVRRNLNNMLNTIQDLFSKQVVQFVKYENSILLANLFKGLFLFPIIIGIAVYTVRQLIFEAKAVIKCIKVLPKKALLDFKTAKFIRRQNILQKALLIPI